MLFDSSSEYPIINGIGSVNSNAHVLKSCGLEILLRTPKGTVA